MRILFFNSSLEPGRDGVGDYVRLLAGACARLGHECAIMALNDPFVPEPTESLPQAPGEIALVRLPISLSWPERLEFVTDFKKYFQPDWISFHLVPYAFHRKGILLGLISTFRALTAGVPLHLMFHELWLGAGRPSPLRFYLTGGIQSFGIRRLLAALRPRLVTASNPVYVAMLRSVGADAHLLPLFGNVPVTEARLLPPVGKLLPETEITEENRAQWWIGLFFGALHAQWKPEPLLSRLLSASLRAEKKICLVLVGRAGHAGDAIWDQLQRDYGTKIVFVRRGEQPAEIISALLQKADFGIATSPWKLIGKSGTAAAMLDHGLPAIVTRDDFQPFHRGDQPPSTDPLLHRCDDELEAKLVAGLPKRAPQARVDEIAAKLVHHLSAA